MDGYISRGEWMAIKFKYDYVSHWLIKKVLRNVEK